ncbi:hypothetical protein GGR51DRAFT_423278 [Nemania sp. FL0031]|nr:hypothetical protein GGR51DRAFT_423278 [Nemania sp. FL0031]
MDDTPTTNHILDPNGDVIIHLRNSNAPFAVLRKDEELYVPTKLNESSKRKRVKYESVTVAPPGHGGNTVVSKAREVPSIASPQIDFRVSSAHLILASPYFQKALDGPFKESQPGIDDLRHVDASDWDAEALLTVLQIIHGRNLQVTRYLDLEMLAKIAVIVDYYECYETVYAFAELWYQQIKKKLSRSRLDRDLILILHVSRVFRWASEFKAATHIALLHSKGPLHTLGLPIPESITSAINDQRVVTLRAIGRILRTLAANLRVPIPACTLSCASMNLGALERQIKNEKELNGLELFGPLDGKSVALTTEATRTIQTPDWTHHPSGRFCSLNNLVKSEMDKLEKLEGLSLKSFMRAA